VLEKNNLQGIQYESHAPISINNNTDFSIQALNEGWDGNGSSTDPYVIEGLEISDSSEDLISIKNTDVHFNIRNNLLDGKLQISNGIYLRNVTNGMISSNEITRCLFSGIILKKSDTNEISGNTITDNGHYILATSGLIETYSRNLAGIYLSASDSNVIKANTVYSNAIGISIYYSSSNLVSMNKINDHSSCIGIFGTAQYNVISNNSITHGSRGGISFFRESPSHNLVTNNTFSYNGEGIRFCGKNNTATDNVFSNNIIAISIGHIEYGSLWKAQQSVIQNNMIYNNNIGIELAVSTEVDILNNSIFSNENYGLKIRSGSSTNVIKWNDFLDNNRPHSSLISFTPSALTAQAFDAGFDNIFIANYWFEWTSPDSDRNGIVDVPYFIDGKAQNNDTSPSASPNNPKNSPTIITPLTNLPGVVIVMMVFITLITLVMVKTFNREAPEKTILYLFIVFVLGSLGVVGVNLLRNFNDLIDPLFFRPPDIFVLTYMLAVILGAFCTYRLVLYYRETHSSQYLLLSGFIFGTAVTLFLWQLWVDYLSRAAVNYSLGLFNLFEPEFLVGLASYFLGMIALLIFAVRLRPWKEYHILLKILIILLGYEIICGGLLYWPFGRTLQWLSILPIGYFNDPQFLFNQLSIVYNLNQLKILPAPISHLSSFQLLVFLINVFIAFAYLTAKPEVKTQKIIISRVFWVIFGLSNILLESISLFNVANVFGLADPFAWFALLSVKQTILLLGLTFLLVIAPESLLITRAQIFQARKLYEKIEKGDLGPRMLGEPRFHLLDYKTRFKVYMDSLPPELKEELKIRP
jgi:parallel beta-helix repeat protein